VSGKASDQGTYTVTVTMSGPTARLLRNILALHRQFSLSGPQRQTLLDDLEEHLGKLLDDGPRVTPVGSPDTR
jgi:hypothetical protein